MKKNIFLFLAIVLTTTLSGQTHHRKTRSDKGGHHHHSAEYYAKHGYGTSSSSDKSSKHHLSSGNTNTSKHGHNSDKSPQKKDTVQTVITPTISPDPAIKAAQDEKYIGYLKIGGIVLAAIIILAIISSSISSRKKRLAEAEKKEQERLAKLKQEEEEKQNKLRLLEEEKQAKIKLKEGFDLALSKKEIWDTHHAELNAKYESLNSSQLGSLFETAKSQKRYKDNLLSKYPENEVVKILNKEYWIGMTEEQLIEINGKPDKIDLEQLKTKTKKIYIYGNKSSGDVFNFVDGVLERFKDR